MLDHGQGREMFYVVAALLALAVGTVVRVRRALVARLTLHPEEDRMDLGIAGRRALVCAASKGLGRGCAEALAREGVRRDDPRAHRSRRAAHGARRSAPPGRPVAWLACDITTPEGRAAALAACPDPDILVNNAGGPPPGDFRDWDARRVDRARSTPTC